MASFVRGWAKTPVTWQRLAPVTTLDVLIGVRFDGQPIVIKMDVEGFEGDVLKGAERTLNLNPKPVWLVEICLDEHFPGGVNRQFVNIFEIFWQHGYEVRTADSSRRLVTSKDAYRWATLGHVDFGSHNYLFQEP